MVISPFRESPSDTRDKGERGLISEPGGFIFDGGARPSNPSRGNLRLKSEGNISLYAIIVQQVIGPWRIRRWPGRADSARGNQMCVKLSDLLLAAPFSSFRSFTGINPLYRAGAPARLSFSIIREGDALLRKEMMVTYCVGLKINGKSESISIVIPNSSKAF